MPVDLPPPPPAFIHAHRGGPTLAGVHTYGEETLSAFRHAHLALGSVLEVDAKLTAEGVPVVIHDGTLDRTTACEGRVDAKTLLELAACPVDVLGSPGGELGGEPTSRTEPIATLAQVLTFAKDSGATVNLEIKNIPNEPDFDPTDGYADTVMDVVLASGFPAERLIIQSFWPPNLDVARRRLPGAATAYLSLAQANAAAPAFAQMRGYDWVSPAWPVDRDFVDDAHARGLKVVPYTINQADQIAAARALGVDAVITDDPLMARRALGIPDAASGDRQGPRVRARVSPVASNASRSPVVRLRWSGEDPSGLAGFEAQVRRIGTTTWRTVQLGGREGVDFRATAGASYVLRVRAQDNLGNLGEFDSASFVVPLDERDRRIALSGGWQRVRRTGAWLRGVSVASGAGPTATVTFRGRRIRVIGVRSPRGGRFTVTVDGRRRTVTTRGRAADRRILFDSKGLGSGRHTLRLRALGGGPVALDAIAVS